VDGDELEVRGAASTGAGRLSAPSRSQSPKPRMSFGTSPESGVVKIVGPEASTTRFGPRRYAPGVSMGSIPESTRRRISRTTASSIATSQRGAISSTKGRM
jgi:hypothetical protein